MRYYHVGHTIVTQKGGHLNSPEGKLERKFQLDFNNVVRVFWGEREVRKTFSAQKRVQENTQNLSKGKTEIKKYQLIIHFDNTNNFLKITLTSNIHQAFTNFSTCYVLGLKLKILTHENNG